MVSLGRYIQSRLQGCLQVMLIRGALSVALMVGVGKTKGYCPTQPLRRKKTFFFKLRIRIKLSILLHNELRKL